MDCLWKDFKKVEKSYYNILVDPEKLFGRNGQSECNVFIYQHFLNGGKSEVFDLDFRKKYFESGKHIHTVALYLLGLSCEKIFDFRIRKYLETQINQDIGWYSFKHLWFLLCLYHDVASCIETDCVAIPNNSYQKQLQFFLKEKKIRINPYNALSNKGNNPKRLRNLAENYFCYRMDQGALDHGIIGGFILYKNLIDIFVKAQKLNDNNKEFIFKDLYWNKDYIKLFAIIADAIIRHNMWTVQAGTEDAKLYLQYGLDDLIVGKGNRIKLTDNPILFMLCLLDSIEPIKRMNDKEKSNSQTILNNISISPSDESNASIKIGWNTQLEGIRGFGAWRKNVEELPDWMGVEIGDVYDGDFGRNQCIRMEFGINE